MRSKPRGLADMPAPVLIEILDWLDLPTIAAAAGCCRALARAAPQGLVGKMLRARDLAVCTETSASLSPAAAEGPRTQCRLFPVRADFAACTVTFEPRPSTASTAIAGRGVSPAFVATRTIASPPPVLAPDATVRCVTSTSVTRVRYEGWTELIRSYYSGRPQVAVAARLSASQAAALATAAFHAASRPELERMYWFNLDPGHHVLGEPCVQLVYETRPPANPAAEPGSVDAMPSVVLVRAVAHISWLLSTLRKLRPPPVPTNQPRAVLLRTRLNLSEAELLDERMLALLAYDSRRPDAGSLSHSELTELASSLAAAPAFPPIERRIRIEHALRAQFSCNPDSLWKYSFVKRFIANPSEVADWSALTPDAKTAMCAQIALRVSQSELAELQRGQPMHAK